MKKWVLLIVIVFAVTAAASAQTYTVQEITGRVERDAGNGRWEVINTGDTLRADTIIRTVIGASLTVRSGNDVVTIGAMRSGRLAELLGSGAVIQIQGRVSQADTDDAGRVATRVTTASARASDAAGDVTLEE